jgi:aldehyde:ferredoxin oxidoreductase
MHGYWGKLLRVDLTNRVCRIDDIPEETFSLLMGGSALGAKILLEETPAKVDPLSPENKLIFAVGPFQGVKFPGNGKWSVITKGPLTGTFLESAGTGHWGPISSSAGLTRWCLKGRPTALSTCSSRTAARRSGTLRSCGARIPSKRGSS